MTYGELTDQLLQKRETVKTRRYALAVPVAEDQENHDLKLLFEVRAETLRTQPGEVCFPGGGIEGRETPDRAALRELREELGLTGELGLPLEPVRHQAGFSAEPFLVRLPSDWDTQLRLNPDEVGEVFTVPLSFFQKTEPELYRCRIRTQPPEDFPYEKLGFPDGSYRWREGKLEVPVWMWGQHPIWGLTARVVLNLVRRL